MAYFTKIQTRNQYLGFGSLTSGVQFVVVSCFETTTLYLKGRLRCLLLN